MLFTKEYREQQQKLHDTGMYGCGGNADAHYESIIRRLADTYKCGSILDYGAGSNLHYKKYLAYDYKYTPYDIIEELYHEPEAHDMVIAVDVLEHIEPMCLHNVLDHMQELANKIFFASVHTAPAKKTLEDGRNAHLIQKPMEWWFPKIAARFNILQLLRVSNMEFFVIAARREDAAATD
jgi:hypothetical protein